MPKKKTIELAREDERAGKALSMQAGEFVREEIELIRKGARGARSAAAKKAARTRAAIPRA